jgi:hypothetical protein
MKNSYNDEELKEMAEQLSLQQQLRSKEEVIATLKDDLYGASEEEVVQIIENYDKRKGRNIKKRKIKTSNKALEIIAQDFKKAGRGIARGVVYGVGIPAGAFLGVPTLIRKLESDDGLSNQLSDNAEDSLRGASGLMLMCNVTWILVGYSILTKYGKGKLALTLGLTQLGTNAISGIYEYARYVRKRLKENRE